MNKQVYFDYSSYLKYSEYVPTYCNVYIEDVFNQRLELPAALFNANASPLTEKELEQFFASVLCERLDDLEIYRVTFHEAFEIVHLSEECDRVLNYEEFWEACGWKFGNLQEIIEKIDAA